MPTEFRLRFPLSEVAFWAARYAYADDAEVEAIGETARKRGWYTRDEFLAVMCWKTARTQSRCAMNTEAAVRSATRRALSTEDVHERMNSLLLLHGVAFPTASVLLHLAHRDPYPILDFRALWSLGIDAPPAAYSLEFWGAYTRECRSLSEKAGVSMRTLDRALWQYSKEREVPAGSLRSARREDATRRDIPDRAPKDDVTRPISGVRDSPRRTMEAKDMPRSRKYQHRPDLHARLIETAMRGQLITYSALLPNRRKVGDYLYRIAKEEQAAGRPPLTALVVHKVGGKPGPGFIEAAKWVGFWREGETEDEVWRRAVETVHEYWRPKLTDDLD
jgi:hypothetical protein